METGETEMERQRDGEIERSGLDEWKFAMVEEVGYI
jgi:hypothetical protein